MIAALAGRRIDALESRHRRFPLENVPLVSGRTLEVFRRERVGTLICSAACGADLLALSVAEELGIQCRIVLPFEKMLFRETSVVDRPGNWGMTYDRILSEAERSGNLVILGYGKGYKNAYKETNARILNEAAMLSEVTKEEIRSIILWDGRAHAGDDTTLEFLKAARTRNLPILEISTL